MIGFIRIMAIISLAGHISGLAVKSNRGDAIKAPIPGYGVQDFEWEVQYNQDKPAVKLNGTVEQVQAKLLQLNPNYEVDMADIIAKYHKEREEASTAFQARDLNKRDWTICNNFPDAANVYGGVNGGSGIQGGIDYLRGVAGSPTNGPGPGNCGRVSCDYGAAIWWCNDNTYTFTLNTYNDIANAAQVVVNDCQYFYIYGWYVSGQRFMGNNWNTIVHQVSSC